MTFNVTQPIWAGIHVSKLTYVCLLAQLALDIGTQTRVEMLELMLELRRKGAFRPAFVYRCRVF